MPDFTPEQLENIRFCLDNWNKIKLFRDIGLFEDGVFLANIQDNFSPDGKMTVKHFHFTGSNRKINVKELSTVDRKVEVCI
jgi:hypothetical protein